MDKGTVIRTVLLILALVNQVLSAQGKSPLPIEDAQAEAYISGGFTAVASLLAWWKNNYVSKKGLEQKKVLQDNGLVK